MNDSVDDVWCVVVNEMKTESSCCYYVLDDHQYKKVQGLGGIVQKKVVAMIFP